MTMVTPRQSEQRVLHRIGILLAPRFAFVALMTTGLVAAGGSVVPTLVGLVACSILILALIRFWLWRREAPFRKARPPSWLTSVPPALAAQIGVAGHEKRRDRAVQGRLERTPDGFGWRPTKTRPAYGFPDALRWDSSWRPVLTRPWFLRIYGAGRLTLSRPGDDDAIVWVSQARDFGRVTGLA